MPQEEKERQHPVTRQRVARNWTQGELASRAEIPRTTVSAIEGGRLTPSVTAALALARALECTVEELFGAGRPPDGGNLAQWAWEPPRSSARYWQAEIGGKRMLIPVESLCVNPIAHDGVWNGREDAGVALAEKAGSTLVVATCDPAAGLLANEYSRVSGFRMVVLQRGGGAALDLLRAGRVHVAGLHRTTPEHPERNIASVREKAGGGYRLLRLAEWEEGLVVPVGERSCSPAAISKRCKQWALREPGSAARECLDELLGRKQPEGHAAPGHIAVAEMVRSGWAEAGVCVRLAAEEAGLNFLPIRTESLDLCYAEAVQNDPRLHALLRLLGSGDFRRMLGELPGYHTRHTGEVVAV